MLKNEDIKQIRATYLLLNIIYKYTIDLDSTELYDKTGITSRDILKCMKALSHIEAEETVVNELKTIGKPYIVLLNSVHPNLPETERLAEKLKETYCVPVFKELSSNNLHSQHNICPGYFCKNRTFDEISANEFYDIVERTIKYVDRELTDDPKLGWNFIARAKAFNKTVLDSLTIKEYIWRIDYKKLEEEMEKQNSKFIFTKTKKL